MLYIGPSFCSSSFTSDKAACRDVQHTAQLAAHSLLCRSIYLFTLSPLLLAAYYPFVWRPNFHTPPTFLSSSQPLRLSARGAASPLGMFTRTVVLVGLIAGGVHLFRKDLTRIAKALKKPAETFVKEVRKELDTEKAGGAAASAPSRLAEGGVTGSAGAAAATSAEAAAAAQAAQAAQAVKQGLQPEHSQQQQQQQHAGNASGSASAAQQAAQAPAPPAPSSGSGPSTPQQMQ